MSDPDGPTLTIGAAARRLGVAVETLRSWERRYGLGPAARTPGVHRRYSSADMARLDRFCRLVGEGVATADAAAAVLAAAPVDVPGAPAGQGPLPMGRSGGGPARGLARCAVRMDTPKVVDLLEQAIAREGVVGAWESTIEPALLAVGRKWGETGGRYVEVEHHLSWCVSAALHRSAPAPAPAPASAARPEAGLGRRRVLLACAPGEWHCLPMEVLRVALLERDVPVCMLGAAVPAEALRAAVRRVDPSRVVVWSQVPQTADPAALPRSADSARSTVLAAGPGWAGARASGVRVLDTLAEAVRACSPNG